MSFVPDWLNILMQPVYKSRDGRLHATTEEAQQRDEWLGILPELCRPERMLEALNDFELSYVELAKMVGCSERHLHYIAKGRRRMSEALVLRLYPALIELDKQRKAWRTPRCLMGLVQ